MKKRIIIILSISIVLILGAITALAAFVFTSTITVTNTAGNIEIIEKKFISYAPDVDYDAVDEDTQQKIYPGGKADANYLEAIKARETEGVLFTQDSVICYASEKEGYNEELTPTTEVGNRNYFYLCQLGFQISFRTDIDVYIRIHFSDAWIKTKTYNGNTQEPEYMLRDQFNVDGTDSNWVYDSRTNTQNYTRLISASTTAQSYSFSIDDDYFYNAGALVNGHQSVMVQVSFTVDIIQANRAKTVWGYDPTTL